MITNFVDNSSQTVKTPELNDFNLKFDNSLRRWFSRNLGVWCSKRQYFFEEEDVLHVEMFLRIEELKENVEECPCYRFSWWVEKENDFFIKKPFYSKEGVIEAYLFGHQLHRNSSYLSQSSVVSNIRQVDEHELIFDSSYDDWNILEHTRLIDQDCYRSRNIYSWSKNKLKIVENHHEIRVFNHN
ncbi:MULTISPECIES: hypothetical protein [Prochlorococcus]|uniref:Chromophore lyase CpcS/CpeS n=1 Tax=Prochlorococcus marinus (strain SARG / CCMP1375 / SS120) TaxID=167539 RepID=Q7VBH2_PROMA|nr:MULTISPECIES: hypothetical protein [Prochlorococcus]AAQ00165.1 Predicted protein [Prochlorococcus marinus subsp. marinus str. CCMP1375]KGG13963.1 hypothetical protein EV04_0448 [Prochlorococcus marinus str. LG]KGG19096.1 hypothetical protein EV08_1583 [Prochlorococcus marinus str. SS2]KGG23364.1 hypothetical protein EV09_0988 [Prochlorococcus marinus str. SS35]KGG32400.1 hypothetical protein EV10_1515 [Prochlorococcus marinus str. SS51]